MASAQAIAYEVRVEAGDWPGPDRLKELARRAGEAVATVADVPGGAEADILFTSDTQMAELNQQWRGKTGPTDVLSFAPPGPRTPHLGGLALCDSLVAADAARIGWDRAAHIQHLVIHGTFHLLGHDHETPEDASAMEALEARALATLGLPDPYRGQP